MFTIIQLGFLPTTHLSLIKCLPDQLALDSYSRGLGGLGIPGDLSSQSRFVKVAFTKLNSLSLEGELESVSQFFHILDSVAQKKGCCEVAKDKYEITLYRHRYA